MTNKRDDFKLFQLNFDDWQKNYPKAFTIECQSKRYFKEFQIKVLMEWPAQKDNCKLF
jgi:hypothetical protein